MNNNMTIMTVETAVAFGRVAIDEDLVRKSLIDALEVIKKAYNGEWFKLNKTAQTFIINMEQHINDELNALLRGTYVEFVEKQRKEGRRRLENMCV